MIEVEAKVKIEAPEEYRGRIKKLATFVKKQKKVDDYYSLENLKKYPQKSLRIRKTGDVYVVNFKKRVSYAKGVHAKKESEFEVSDIKNFIKLIEDFGFKKWLTKEKTSEIYKIEKNFHIEINQVKNLGWFLEIEYLAENNIDKARKKVIAVMKKLGFSEKETIKQGYTKMLWKK